MNNEEIEKRCDNLVVDLDTFYDNLINTNRFYRQKAEKLLSELREIQGISLPRGKYHDFVLYTGICMAHAIAYWRKANKSGKVFADEILDHVVQLKKRNVRSTNHDLARYCIPNKDKRHYSRYAEVIKTAIESDWSHGYLYERLYGNGGIKLILSHHKPDIDKLDMLVSEMKTKWKTKRKNDSYDPASPVAILAYRDSDGRYSIKKVTVQQEVILRLYNC